MECVICGAEIPEGTQVCYSCRVKNEGKAFESLMKSKDIQFEINDAVEQAFRQGYEEGIRQMEEKHLSECRQISEYDRELREAKRLLGEMLKVMNNGTCAKDCSDCKYLSSIGCDYKERFEWKHTDEVVKLMGGEENGWTEYE